MYLGFLLLVIAFSVAFPFALAITNLKIRKIAGGEFLLLGCFVVNVCVAAMAIILILEGQGNG